MSTLAPNPSRRSSVLRTIVSCILGMAFLCVGFVIFKVITSTRSAPPEQTAITRRIAVQAQKIHRVDHRETHVAYGMTRSTQHARVTSQVTGVIAWVSDRLRSGIEVKAGVELLRIDDSDLRDEVAKAIAAKAQEDAILAQILADRSNDQQLLLVKRKELELSRKILARLDVLVASNAESVGARQRQEMLTLNQESLVLAIENRIRSSKPAEQKSRAAIANREAEVKLVRRQLDRAVIKAPVDGCIGARFAHRGGKVDPGTVLFELIDPHHLEMEIRLPSTAGGVIDEGAAVKLFLGPAHELVYMTQVSRISAEVQADDSQFCVWIDIDAQKLPQPLLQGALVRTEVEGRMHRDVIPIPRDAMVGKTVFLARRLVDSPELGLVESVNPTFAAILHDVALVSAGIGEDDEVILSNVEAIDQGSRITFAAVDNVDVGTSPR